mmetsp:Transcript_13355/g.20995  ORF Transcript_13355/g.20995 Transcript_13355/m.20995 type:complete len:121 (+) Transcript_13355:606-968(+)|eukprot:CAMPEP_0117014806 /NCGR_PEP_ID=MMETSP0472-20121206/11943_1 /TAXON_ID=693140 ORGANISM="Tiarina fusus, Strain LIS" /NCGR_SAMPLE_ID=MMETSP0472 /ASSEMBLY_ACC=CAM_ASM_000603 /LENGTH=120 /DNA_ID=CAMNT_0004718457 /DNA_START=601 /DNA_END=963 /DNA_ORIENTATION=-
MICGNLTVWKGAETTNLITLATTKIIGDVLERNNAPEGVLTTVIGTGNPIGEMIVKDPRLELISFTGSTKVGSIVSDVVHKRFGKCLLELGGNNAVIIMDDANIEMAMKGCVFSAVGTCG